MFVMKAKTSQSKSFLLIIIIINLAMMFVVVVLAKSDHDHDHHYNHHHHQDHPHGHKLNKAMKIYNGNLATKTEAKFNAAIMESLTVGDTVTGFRLVCSAVIITYDMLLTAAHCFDNKSFPQIRRMEIFPAAVQINAAYYLMNKDLIKTIQHFWIHPEYDSKLNTYDLAIIKVGPTPWRLADDPVTVAQMPIRVKWRQRMPFKAYGYGKGEDGIMTGFLNYIEFTREYTQEFCELMFGVRWSGRNILFANKEQSHHHHLHKSSGQASGDSGGGVFLHGTVERLDTSAKKWIQIDTEILVGIHSSHHVRQETMRPRTYFFHTNITTFLPWIKRYSDARFETYPFPYPLR